jgi:hypothetical protein
MVPRHRSPNPPQNPSLHGSGSGGARGGTRAWQRHLGIGVALLAHSLPGSDRRLAQLEEGPTFEERVFKISKGKHMD